MYRKQLKITISFRDTEADLYQKIKNSSCCPTVYVKDILIRHFAAMDTNKKSN